MADVFISYQRKQEAIVRALKERFESAGKDVWVDLEDIPKAADWLQQIDRGIEGATAFVCVLSPEYMTSEICTEEVAHARVHKKQIVPIVRDIDPKAVPQSLKGLPWEAEAANNWNVLRALNWIFARETDDFEKAFQELLAATETDLPFEEFRARLTVRAREWVSRDRNTNYVLRGTDLVEAEQWLAQSSTKKLGASTEQIEYITSSRRAATARQRVTVGALTAGLLVATVLAIVAILNGNRAQANFLGAESRRLAIAANAALQSDNFDLAVLLGIRALRMSYSADAELTLNQAMAQTAGMVYRGHAGPIYSVAYSPDGQFGLTGGDDGTARLWDLVTGHEVRRFVTGSRTLAVCFSPDGRYALTGSAGGAVQLWDVETGQLVRDYQGHTRDVFSVAYSPDEQYILSGGDDRTARLWEAATGKQVRSFDQPPDNVAGISGVAFAADGRYALTARGWNVDMYDGSARVWDVKTGQLLREFSGQGAALSSIAFSPAQNGYVLTSGYDHKARLWDWFSGQAVQVFSGNSQFNIFASVSPDGLHVLTGGDGIVWDAATGVVLRRLTEDGAAVEHGAFSPDGRYVFGSIGDHARLWDLNTGPELHRVTSAAGAQSHASFSPDGQTILIVGNDHTVSLLDTRSNAVKMRFPSSTAMDARFSPDGQFIYTSGPAVERWAVADGQAPVSLAIIPRADQFTISPDGRYMLLIQGGPNKAVELWSLATPHLVRIFDGNHLSEMSPTSIGDSYSMAYAPDGRSIAAGSTHGVITVWDLATGTESRHFGADNTITALAYSPDGQLLLSGDATGNAHIWEVATGRERVRLAGLTAGISSVAFSPDGRYALTASDNTLRLWDAATGAPLQIFADSLAGSASVTFSPDGRYALTTGIDSTVRLWPLGRDALIELACSRTVHDLSAAQRVIYGVDDSPTCPVFGVPVIVKLAGLAATRQVSAPLTTELPALSTVAITPITATLSPTPTAFLSVVPPSPTATLVPATIQLAPVPTHTAIPYFVPLEPPTSEAKG